MSTSEIIPFAPVEGGAVRNDYGQDAPLMVVYWDPENIARMCRVGPAIPYYAECVEGLPAEADLFDARMADGRVAFVFLCIDWPVVAQGQPIPVACPRYYLDKVIKAEPDYPQTPMGRLVATIPL